MICVPFLGQQGRVQELRPPSHLRDRRNAFALPLLPQTLVANLLQQWCHGRNQATFNLCIGATLVELAPQGPPHRAHGPDHPLLAGRHVIPQV
jgi:hypothetical protein